MYTCVFHWIVL